MLLRRIELQFITDIRVKSNIGTRLKYNRNTHFVIMFRNVKIIYNILRIFNINIQYNINFSFL